MMMAKPLRAAGVARGQRAGDAPSNDQWASMAAIGADENVGLSCPPVVHFK